MKKSKDVIIDTLMKKSEDVIIDSLSVGDILLTKNETFIGKSIRFFMYLKAIALHIWNSRPLPSFSNMYNHARTVIAVNGFLMFDDAKYWIVESAEKGTEIRAVPISSILDSKIKTRKVPLTDKEKESIVKEAILLTLIDHPYDFFNFWFHIKRIFRYLFKGKDQWDGPKELAAKKKLYCSELAAWLQNAATEGFFEKPWATDLVDIDFHPDLITKKMYIV